MAKKIKLALIGCGGMSRGVHIPGLKTLENIEVVATCDILKDRAESAAKTLDAKHAFTDYKDVLALDGLDMVNIVTPNYLHSEISIAALNAGLHVFCEKPDAMTVEQAMAMKAAADKSGKHLMVMRNWRYTTPCQYIRKYVADGNMGEIYAGRCGWIRRRGIPGMGGWFTTKALSGGGPLIDLGVHVIDASMWIMGNPKPVAVYGSTYNKFAKTEDQADSEHAKFGDKKADGVFDVEDLAIGMIKFDNGCALQIEFSWASNVEAEYGFIEMRGTKAGFKWEGSKPINNLTLYTDDAVSIVPTIKPGGQAHMENIKHFVDDVLIGGKEPNFKPEQGVEMIKILTGIYKSAETGKEVLL